MMDKLRQCKNVSWFVLLFFICVLLLGLYVVDDYGVSADEFFERNSSLVNFKYIFEDFLIKRDDQKVMAFLENTPELANYPDRYYGVLMQLPTVIPEAIRVFSLDTRYVLLIRHIWTFLNFYVALICFYKLLSERFRSRMFGLLGVVFLLLSPKIFAESFYNIKDVLFLSWVIINFYIGRCFLRHKSTGFALLFGLSSAIAINIRIIGILIPLLVVCQWVWDELIRKQKNTLIALVVYLALTSFLVVLFSPVLWENPFKEFIAALAEFSSFHHNPDELFFGRMVQGGNVWYYVPANIWVTTPLFYTLLFIMGLCMFFASCLLRKGTRDNVIGCLYEYDRFSDFFAAGMLLIPLAAQMIMKSVIYDSWRHYYFVYASILYFAVWGFSFVWTKVQQKKLRTVLAALTLCTLIYTGAWMIIAHPLENLYLNPLMQRFNTDFPRDYWGLSYRKVLEDAVNLAVDDQKIDITGKSGYYTFNNYLILPKTLRAKLQVHSYSMFYNAMYYIHVYERDQSSEIEVPFYEKIKDYEVDGIRYASLYRYHDPDYHKIDPQIVAASASENDEDFYLALDNNVETQWSSKDFQSGDEWIEIEFDQPYLLDRIDLENHQYLGFAALPKVLCSSDMTDWQVIELAKEYDNFRHIFDPVKCKAIRIQNLRESDRPWTVSEIDFYGKIL